jgi:predicted secreted protein
MQNRSAAAAAIWGFTAWWVAGLCASAAAEDADEPRRRVSFSVESAREVSNDWIRAVVGVTEEDADPAQAADRVNRTMAWALEQARGDDRVKTSSGGYHTQPVYHEGKLRRWRASQELVLEGGDPDAMTELLGILQSRVQLRAFGFSVSEERRRRVEEELVSEALGAFRARAELVRRGLEARGYALDELAIDTGGHHIPARRAMRTMETAVHAAVAPPPAEAGTSRIRVVVNGSIVLE